MYTHVDDDVILLTRFKRENLRLFIIIYYYLSANLYTENAIDVPCTQLCEKQSHVDVTLCA